MDDRIARRVPDIMSSAEWTQLMASLRLSPREADVIGCAFYDERDCAIAQRLGISQHTVHTHRARLFRKLGVRTTAQLFAVVVSAHLALRNEPGARQAEEANGTRALAGDRVGISPERATPKPATVARE